MHAGTIAVRRVRNSLPMALPAAGRQRSSVTAQPLRRLHLWWRAKSD